MIPVGSRVCECGWCRNAGLVHMTKTLAVQLGRLGITVNCINPGTTRMSARLACLPLAPSNWAYPRKKRSGGTSPQIHRGGNPVRRMVDASEVAFVAAFLASKKAWPVSDRLVVASDGAGRSVYY